MWEGGGNAGKKTVHFGPNVVQSFIRLGFQEGLFWLRNFNMRVLIFNMSLN